MVVSTIGQLLLKHKSAKKNNNDPDIQVENREIHFRPCSIQLTKICF